MLSSRATLKTLSLQTKFSKQDIDEAAARRLPTALKLHDRLLCYQKHYMQVYISLLIT